jgi:hypothetical protein
MQMQLASSGQGTSDVSVVNHSTRAADEGSSVRSMTTALIIQKLRKLPESIRVSKPHQKCQRAAGEWFTRHVHGIHRIVDKMSESTQGLIVSDETVELIVTLFKHRCCRSEHEAESYVGYLPTAAIVKTLIQTAFWASQTQEEGRVTPVRLILAEPDNQTCIIGGVPISTENLRKLSPFLDDEESWLFVNQQQQIAGVGRCPLGALAIQINRYRSIVVSVDTMYERDVLALMESGTWSVVGDSAAKVTEILSGIDGLSHSSGVTAELLCRIAVAARQHGRGAIYVLMPSDNSVGIDKPKYTVNSFDATPLVYELEALAPDIGEVLSTTFDHYKMHSELSKLAGLKRLIAKVLSAGAGIDGACIIDTPSFSLRGFGAKIRAPCSDSDVEVLELPATNWRTVSVSNIGGMRHQSAANLVAANNDAQVLTISQDGTVSLFVWSKKLVMVKHLDRYLAAE